MASTRPLSRNSVASPQNTNGKSLLYFRKRSLGDKLQIIAAQSPKHLRAVELFVDLILVRLNSEVSHKTRTRWVVLVIALPLL